MRLHHFGQNDNRIELLFFFYPTPLPATISLTDYCPQWSVIIWLQNPRGPIVPAVPSYESIIANATQWRIAERDIDVFLTSLVELCRMESSNVVRRWRGRGRRKARRLRLLHEKKWGMCVQGIGKWGRSGEGGTHATGDTRLQRFVHCCCSRKNPLQARGFGFLWQLMIGHLLEIAKRSMPNETRIAFKGSVRIG